MACPECEKNKKKTAKDFTKAVVEIKNPDKLVLFRKVVVPASMGTEEQFPASVGKFSNVLLQYEANGDTYLYSSDGIPTQLSSDVSELQRQLDELKIVVTNEIADRIAADGTINSRIDQEILDRQAADNDLSDALAAEVAARKAADNTLDGKITTEKNARIAADNTLQTHINNEATARAAADSTLDGKITTEKEAREAADQTLQTNINNEATTRANADTALGTRITNETTARQNADNALDGRITTEANTRSAADSALAEDISAEVTRAKAAETALGGRIDDEATTRAAADTTLDGKITAEATARANADSTLDGKITDEATARANADTALGTRITDETTARTNADTAINNKLNRNVLYDLEMQTDANNVTFVEDKVNLGTGATTTERDVIPAASPTTAGTISASEYVSLVDAEEKITALLEGAVAIDNLPANPTQQQLTNAWLAATGKTELINRASIYDSANQLVHTYYTNVSEWEDSPAGGQITIDQFTNSAAGIIKGSTTDGNVSANLDGTGTVSGWTALKNTVAGKANSSDLATVATSGSYNDLSNKPTIPTVNNATLTIQKNGTTVKTFTANASTNVTANITVPTKTSDITNDSNYVSDANYVHTDNNFTTTLKNKLDGIAAGAEVNQNAFSNVKVGSTTVAADSKTDTLELVAGSNVTLTPDATNDKVTIAATAPTKTSDLTNDSGYITNTVNNLTNYTTTAGMNTALDGKVNIQSINLSNKTTTLLDEAKALGAANVDYARFICRTDGGAANISDLPVSGKGFSCVMYQTRHNTNSDYHYELVCYVKGDYRPYYARMETSTSALTWSQISTAAFSGSYNDLTNKPAINNGTLTIQKNGTNVATFTANQSGNATANITVPTKVTDLTDATNYVAKDGDFYVTGEGSNFSMTGTSQNVYADLKVKGDTQQTTYAGKNLNNGVSQGYFINTATTGCGKIDNDSGVAIAVQANTNYTVSTTTTQARYRVAVVSTLPTSSETVAAYNGVNRDNKSKSITINSGSYTYLVVNATDLSAIQVEAGSSATAFEPYVGGVPAPNPDYPQEVEVVAGRQVITSMGKNLMLPIVRETASSGVKMTYNESTGELTASGTATTNWSIPTDIFYNYLPTGTYTIKQFGTLSNGWLSINGYYTDGTALSDRQVDHTTYTRTFTITKPLAMYYITITSMTSGQPVTGTVKFQLEKGSTATGFEPCLAKEYPVDLAKNMLDISTLTAGYVAYDGSLLDASNNGEMRSKFIKVRPKTTYTFSIKETSSTYPAWFGVGEYKTNNTSSFVTRATNTDASATSVTFTTDATVHYVILSARNLAAATKAQFEVGPTPTIYEPYNPIELCKIGAYQDYIYPSGGKWYLHKDLIKINAESSRLSGFNNHNSRYITVDHSLATTGKLVGEYEVAAASDRFVGASMSQTWNGQIPYCVSKASNANSLQFALPLGTGSTIDDIKTFLDNHPTIVYYPLATPTDTEITNPLLVAQLDDLWRNLQSGTNTTNVNVEGDLPAILGVTAFTNTLASAMAGINERMNRLPAIPQITMTTTDPGEGQTLADNHYIAVYE